MDSSENTAKLVDNTYKNITDEFGPCAKQLIVAGRTYLKSLQAMVTASRQYTDALSKMASLANNSTLRGSSDIGSAIYNIVDVNKELLAHQSNIVKSLEFEFLAPMEITADKDTKLLAREQKRFHQLYKGRKEAYLKCVSTLKKTRRKKTINTEKQLAHMKMLESAKERLEIFCDDSLKEALMQERIIYGTVLEKQCVLNQQILTYHTRGCELFDEQLPHWKTISEKSSKLPESYHDAVKNEKTALSGNVDDMYTLDSLLDVVIRNNSIARSYGTKDRHSTLSHNVRLNSAEENIYARPMMRAKSEFCLPTSSSLTNDSSLKRFSRVVEYADDSDEGEERTLFARVLYSYEPTGDYQLGLREGDLVEYVQVKDEDNSGWQFGDNLRSKRSGWFPVSYTEPVKDVTKFINNGSHQRNGDCLPPPPPPPATVSSNRSKSYNQQMFESSEYATLTRMSQKKPVPVEPPTVTASFQVKNGHGNGTLKSMQQYASHPNISDAPMRNGTEKFYHNGQHVPSVRL